MTPMTASTESCPIVTIVHCRDSAWRTITDEGAAAIFPAGEGEGEEGDEAKRDGDSADGRREGEEGVAATRDRRRSNLDGGVFSFMLFKRKTVSKKKERLAVKQNNEEKGKYSTTQRNKMLLFPSFTASRHF